MNTIICNSVEIVLKDEILYLVYPGQMPVLKDGVVWKKIDVAERPVYLLNVKQTDSGPTNEETVTVKANQNEITEYLHQYCAFYMVLKMSTDNGIFYIGTFDYPCVMEFTSDKIYDSYTFKAVSPA